MSFSRSKMMVRVLMTAVLLCSMGTILSARAQQQTAADGTGVAAVTSEISAPSPAGVQSAGASFWQIIRASGIIGLVIFALSVAGLALVIEHAISIRRNVLLPPELVSQIQEALQAGQVARVSELLREQHNALARVVRAGFSELDLGWPSVEKAMEEALAEESARLYRKVEYLSVIGNVAPMLGLLGTVVGMIVAFRRVAETQGAARAADLAEGIYLALVTTVEGLLVAIPAIAAFAFFRNKIDGLVAEIGLTADRLMAPVKRHLLSSGIVSPRTAVAARPPRTS
jgi:biopolymer transport protein ExbB